MLLHTQTELKRYRALHDSLPTICFHLNPVGVILSASQFTAQRLGYKLEELLGQSIFSVFCFDAPLISLTEFQGFLHQPSQDIQWEGRQRCKDGQFIWIKATARSVETGADRPTTVLIGQDITERKLAEATLQTSEARNRALVNAIPDLMFRLHRDGTYLDFKAGKTDLLVPPEAVVGKTAFELLPPDVALMALQAVEQAIVLDEIQIFEYEMLLNDEVRNFEARVVASGAAEAIAIVRDITKRRRVELDLAESREKYKTLFEILPIGISITDQAGNIISVNPASERILGISRAEQIARTYDSSKWQVIRLDGTPLPAAEMPSVRALTENRVIENVEIGHVSPDGRTTWLSVTAAPIPLDKFGVTIAYIDITEQQAARRERKQAEMDIDCFFSLCPDVLCICSFDGHFRRINPAFCSITGYSAEEILATRYVDFLHPDDRLPTIDAVTKLMLGLPIYSYENRYRCKDGSYKWLDWSTIGLPAEGVLYAVGRDITERKQMQAELWQQAERERLVSTITQHIRQSLNLEDILQTTVAEVRQFLQADRVIVYHLQPDFTRTIVMEAVLPEWVSMQEERSPFLQFTETCLQHFQQGNIRAIDDIYTSGLPSVYIDAIAPFQVRAFLVVPILQEKHLWGALVIHHCSRPWSWQPWEIDLLQQIATQVAIAIQQSELYEQVQSLNTHLEQQVEERTAQLKQSLDFEALLKRITDKVRDSLDEKQILQTAVQELAVGLGVECCDTGLYNLKDNTCTIQYEYTLTLPPAQGSVVPMLDLPDLFAQILQGRTVQFCRIFPHPTRPINKRFAVLACPIFDDQGILGDLWLFKPSDASFSDPEIRLIQQVSNQCAIALRQAELYQASQAQVTQLETLNVLKDDFLSTVSHELRTPISNIKMAIEMLEVLLEPESSHLYHSDQLRGKRPQVQRYFQILQAECQKEIELINDLLDLQRLETGTQPLMLTTIRLQEWLPHLIEPFEARTQLQQQVLTVDIPADLPTVTSDLSSLGRIFTELLSNACKYTEAGERITVRVSTLQEMIYIDVSNTGVEIPAHELPLVFEKFYRVPNLDPWKHGGTGLGLALVKKLIAHLGGSVCVESASGQTRFSLELPLSQARSVLSVK